MQIAYTALTETCTLLLDGEGICRSVLAASAAAVANGRDGRTSRIPASAEKCIGAQYVATIDVREPGGMVQSPKPGAQMLFARTEKNGRITLVRSAPVIRFETAAPVVESGVHARPDDTDTLAAVRPEQAVSYGDDDEPTIQQSHPPERRSSLPPPRSSGVVPVGKRAGGTTVIPPPPALPRVREPDSETRPIVAIRPPTAPKRPSVVRVSAPDWELATRPFKRAAR